MDLSRHIARLASDLVAIDSRSRQPSADAVERCLAELPGFDVERIDYRDAAGVDKRVAVARRGRGPCLALCGHVDTVEDAGWTADAFAPRIDGGALHGLGAVDMKGPLASMLAAARVTTAPIMVLLSADEETTKAGAEALANRSAMVRAQAPAAIVIGEPTGLAPVRGHRATIEFTVRATGVQAHTATGQGRSAVWDLVAFLAEAAALRREILSDPRWADPDFDPPASDLNVVIADAGGPLNVTAGRAVARLAWRYSAGIDPDPAVASLRAAAERTGVALEVHFDGRPLESGRETPLVRLAERATGLASRTQPFGTDASVLQRVAPCLILGPGNIAVAHTPREHVALADLVRAVPIYARLAEETAAGAAGRAA